MNEYKLETQRPKREAEKDADDDMKKFMAIASMQFLLVFIII